LSFFRKIRKGAYRNKNNIPKTDSDAIFSLSSATITLETKLGLISNGRCGLTVKSTSGMYFDEMRNEIQRFLGISKPDFELEYRTVIDSYGYLWILLTGKSMEELLAAITAVGDTIQEKGFSSQILASIFEFRQVPELERGSQKNSHIRLRYLVYNYKSNKFYPFVPFFAERSRDTENEMRIMATLQKEIPFEKDMSMWYPLWDLPF
jgi:PspAB-like protein